MTPSLTEVRRHVSRLPRTSSTWALQKWRNCDSLHRGVVSIANPRDRARAGRAFGVRRAGPSRRQPGSAAAGHPWDEGLTMAKPSTRQALLRLLKTCGPQTAGELAQALGVSAVAVRKHLDALERE